MEEISEETLTALLSAVTDFEECDGNSTDKYEALLYVVRKAISLLKEVGYY